MNHAKRPTSVDWWCSCLLPTLFYLTAREVLPPTYPLLTRKRQEYHQMSLTTYPLLTRKRQEYHQMSLTTSQTGTGGLRHELRHSAASEESRDH